MTKSVNAVDLSLYLVTDQALCGSRGLVATVEAALRGGVTALQYRAKAIEMREAIAEASALAELARTAGIPFIINDRLDLALAVDADGLHVGQSDMPPALARRFLAPGKILGLSVTTEAELSTIDSSIIDYVGLGPVFATTTKSDAAPALGLDLFGRLRQAIDLPVVAIGGIDRQRTADLIAAGADGIAVVSAICAAADPTAAARDLQQLITQARQQR
jgi:thiamine-phosphate pyrophosphorylase